jgi:hypothetical protein
MSSVDDAGAEETTFAYFEWSVPGKIDEVDLDDRDLWYQANPSLGYVRPNGSGLREGYIAGVERGGAGMMADDEFARERLGIFNDGDDAVSAIDTDDWAACRDNRKPKAIDGPWMLDPVCLGVHVAKERRSATIAAAGECQGGGLAVEVVDQRRGALWVPDRLVELVESHKPRMVCVDRRFFDPEVLTKLEEAGLVPAATATSASTAKSRGPGSAEGAATLFDVKLEDHIRACAGLFDDIVAHDLRHRAQPVLDTAVDKAATRTVGDAWLWDTRSDEVIPLVAVTLARWGHVQPPPKAERAPLLR